MRFFDPGKNRCAGSLTARIFRSRAFRFGAAAGALCLILASAFLVYAGKCVGACGARVSSDPAQLPANEYGLLLGTSRIVRGKYLNQYFLLRIRAAARLYHAGKVKKLILSGDNRRHGYNEPEDMRLALLEQGVKDSDMLPDCAGFRTLDSVVRAKNVFHARKFTVISQKFHCERAIFIADHRGIEAVGFAAEEVSPAFRFKTGIREPLARAAAWLDVKLLNRQPYFPE